MPRQQKRFENVHSSKEEVTNNYITIVPIKGGDRLQHYVRVTAHVTSVTTAGQYVAQSRRDYDDAVLRHNHDHSHQQSP